MGEVMQITRKTDTDTNEKSSKDDFIHSEQIYIVDSKRRLRGVYNGNANGDIERIAEDVKKLFGK